MTPPIGSIATPASSSDALARARLRAALLPDLLVEAQRIAASVVGGWHGRKRRGIGDSFWQFRPYDSGESLSRIDWRRTARDDAITIRDQEWEAAHTVWVWADESPSMNFRSESTDVSKQSRALVLALALADILVRSGERVGWPGLTRPYSNRNAAERLAQDLFSTSKAQDNFPDTNALRGRCDLVLFSDFLEPVAETLERVRRVAHSGVGGMLVQIIDPVEEAFPYAGRTEFKDPEGGQTLTFGRAEQLEEDYSRLFQARKSELAEQCRRIGWHHLVHHTDQLASAALVDIHTRLSGANAVAG